MTVCDCCMHLFDGLADFCPECQDQFDEDYDEEDISMHPKKMTTLEKLKELDRLQSAAIKADAALKEFLNIFVKGDWSRASYTMDKAWIFRSDLVQEFGREQFEKEKA